MFSDETMATGSDNFWLEKVILFPDNTVYNVCHLEDEQFLPEFSSTCLLYKVYALPD